MINLLYKNDNLIDIYVGEDGKLHKVQGGADSVLPFSNSDFIGFGVKTNYIYNKSGTITQNFSQFKASRNGTVGIQCVGGRHGSGTLYFTPQTIINGITTNYNTASCGCSSGFINSIATFDVTENDDVMVNLLISTSNSDYANGIAVVYVNYNS